MDYAMAPVDPSTARAMCVPETARAATLGFGWIAVWQEETSDTSLPDEPGKRMWRYAGFYDGGQSTQGYTADEESAQAWARKWLWDAFARSETGWLSQLGDDYTDELRDKWFAGGHSRLRDLPRRRDG
jgi:hypothetical protein